MRTGVSGGGSGQAVEVAGAGGAAFLHVIVVEGVGGMRLQRIRAVAGACLQNGGAVHVPARGSRSAGPVQGVLELRLVGSRNRHAVSRSLQPPGVNHLRHDHIFLPPAPSLHTATTATATATPHLQDPSPRPARACKKNPFLRGLLISCLHHTTMATRLTLAYTILSNIDLMPACKSKWNSGEEALNSNLSSAMKFFHTLHFSTDFSFS